MSIRIVSGPHRWRWLLPLPLPLLLFLALPLRAESLADAWRLALERNNALASVRDQADAARAAAGAARAERWPKLTADGSYQRFADAPAFSFPVDGQSFLSPELVDNDDFYTARVRLELPLFTAGRLSAGIEAAELSAQAAASATDSRTQDLKLAVARAYVEVLRSRRAVSAAAAQVARLDALVNDVAVMVETEAVARNDLLAARVTLANARQSLLRVENQAALSLAAYNRLLGESLDRAVTLEELPVTEEGRGEPLESLVARATARRSDLAGLDARTRALDEQARSERASGWPQVGLMADYQHVENQVLDAQDFSLVGIGFNWTVFDAGQIRQRAAAIASAGRAAGRDRDELRSQIELAVHQVWLDRKEARARIDVTREAVAQSEENLRITREGYSVGLVTNTVVLDAEALQLTAVRNQDDALLDAALAELRLKHVIGEL